MDQITNPEQIPPFIHSHIPIIREVECNPTKTQKVDSIIHWSILAMRKLTFLRLNQQPVYQLLTFSCRNTASSYDLLDITAKDVKALLTSVVANNIRFKKVDSSRSQVDNDYINEIQQAQLKINEKELEEQLFQLMACILKELKTHIATRYLKNLSVEWKDNICTAIFDNIFDIIKSCKTFGDLCQISHEDTSKSSDKNNKKPEQRNQPVYWKQLLSKLSGDSKVKLQLYKLLEANQRKIKLKDEQLDKWIKCSKQLEETVRQQMKWIEFQNQENYQLDLSIETLKDQLKLSEDRVKAIQNETQALQRELAELKQPQAPAESYYINPFYEKAQMEEKMFMEMIEAESQLLLGKQQIKLLTESIIEIVKAAQSLLQDIPGTKYYLGSFNRSAIMIMRDLKSMQSFDLEHILNIKEDSLYSSEFMQDARKSQISTFSEIDFDQKSSRITEDDSLLTQGQ